MKTFGSCFVRTAAGTALGAALAVGAVAQEKVTFQDHVLPLVENHCGKCHNADKKKGDLDLTSYHGLLKGGGSGQAVVSGNPDSSKLWKAITHAEEPTMPPNKPRLPDKELEVFRKWIAGGLLETSGSKAVAASKPAVDLALKETAIGKPDGPPPMPQDLSLEPVVHTTRGGPLVGLAASPWAPLVALAGQKQVLLYHTDSRELLGVLAFPEGQPVDVKFSRNGKLLLAGGGHGAKSGRVAVWDVTTGERLMTVGKEFDTVLAADLSPDQSRLALGGTDRLVKIYSTQTGELLHKIKKHTDWVTAVAFSPSGELLATADRNGGINVWDPENAQELFPLNGHKAAVTAVSWRGDSKVLASASEDGGIRLWETTEGKPARNWTAHNGGALSLNFTHDGRLVSCGRDNQVTVWKPDGSKVRSLEFFGELPLRSVFSHDGARVVATDFAGRIAVWNASDGKRLGELPANPLPLAQQVAAAEKEIADIQARDDKPSPAVLAAEAAVAKAAEAHAAAEKAVESAKAEQTAKEDKVVKLKETAAKDAPPADIEARLADARAARQKARDATAKATEALDARARELAAARKSLDQAQAVKPADLLAAAQAKLARLQAAQARSEWHRIRDQLAAQRREEETLKALIAEKQAALKQAAAELETAKESEAQAKLKAAIKAFTAETKAAEAGARKLAAEIAAQQSRLEKLAAEFLKRKTAAAAGSQPAS